MDFASHFQAFSDLCDQAHQDGWISDEQLKSLQHMELQQAESLFAEQTHRPLLIGLFGGTGVGKSSLLNRLAGESIAKTGVEACSTSQHRVQAFRLSRRWTILSSINWSKVLYI